MQPEETAAEMSMLKIDDPLVDKQHVSLTPGSLSQVVQGSPEHCCAVGVPKRLPLRMDWICFSLVFNIHQVVQKTSLCMKAGYGANVDEMVYGYYFN